MKEAEKIAHFNNDKEAEISIALNRALVLDDSGNEKKAEKLLYECRDWAKSVKLWPEYVRSLHRLANLAWLQGKHKLAEKRYKKALGACRLNGFS